MEQTLIVVDSTCVDMALRFWMKDKDTYIVNSALDISKLASKLGCDFFDKRRLDRNLNDYISYFAEKLYSSKLLEQANQFHNEDMCIHT